MFNSKTDHLNWAYISHQLLCDDSSANLTMPWMDGCIAFGFKFLQLKLFITDAHCDTHTLTYLCCDVTDLGNAA